MAGAGVAGAFEHVFCELDSGGGQRAAFVAGLEGLEDAGEADAVVLRVRHAQDDAVGVAAWSSEDDQLDIRFTEFGRCVGTVVAQVLGVVSKVFFGVVDLELRPHVSELDLEEAITARNEHSAQDVKLLYELRHTLPEAFQIQEPGSVKGEVVQHPPGLLECARNGQGLKIGNRESINDAATEDTNLGTDVVLDKSFGIRRIDQREAAVFRLRRRRHQFISDLRDHSCLRAIDALLSFLRRTG